VGVYYPVATLPASLRGFSRLFPPTYVFESMRTILVTGSFRDSLVLNLVIGGLLAIIYLILTSLFFVTIYRKNLESGTIARFNAEAL
jgi:ABC-2 type transport system permease protein